jgi:hypothetical protein
MTNALAQTRGGQLTTIDDPILSDEALWQVVSSGDLKGLTAKQKSDYYLYRCRQEGLNPASQPFQYITFQGREILYAGKTAADQLRKLHGVSITSVQCQDDGETIECEVRVRDRDGREDFEIGTVFVGGAKGPERANAKMKCLSKAKRRATYSICGTGVLDETEVEAMVTPAAVAELVATVSGEVVDRETGEITAPSLNLDDDIKRLRLALGWSDPQSVIAEAARANPPINLKTRAGKQQMVDLLQSYVDSVNDDGDEPEQGSFIDAESRVAGAPGLDRHSA